MTLAFNHDALANISRSLADAGISLDDAGNSMPSAVDGGCGTPAILGILAKLADNTGQLVVGVKAVSEAVAKANTAYLEQDATAAESVQNEIGAR
ncbi:hypothetical protein [Mycolicibacterium bacteremicum]|uniref:ESX-1 secretion-associated protein n=1 Tax=Mycolicibacterium bacteremicum TaxID=564198 RepID=A0A1W9Z2U8_MYCBA|nr:hypothetical protein [Mycolicibacterium bacteremicum]MCV7431994.1 hypothetical protein [Mycolicibacterium bacteremicum]ORA06567.1 hypothetical protein BST17_02615 [Mycolicibacterium bacteremicum]